MGLEAGKQLLHYRLTEQIGEGGMGVVWKAVDTTLDREVAIKTLPAGFADDPERLARFEREAKLLASLNHPNLAAIYGIHQAGDIPFMAMELVPGEDLATRLHSGSLELDEALTVARKVAAALAAAHDNGVIHRDLKPANIRVTPDNAVKVLDFGLAKAYDTAQTSGDPSRSPTITSAGTRTGMILGTAPYMSPEQARGKPVDRRADIWAFGCVLYELLTGRRAFPGETVSDILASILTREPDLDALAGRVPRRVTSLLERCLNKDVAKRPRDAGDIGLELDAALAGEMAVEDAGSGERRSWKMNTAIATVALLAGAGIAYLTGLGDATTAPRSEPRRLVANTGDERPIRDATISRDGKRLFLTLDDGVQVRPFDRYELQPIPDSGRASSVVESPDGRSLVFHNVDEQIVGGGKIRRTSLDTMSTVVLDESPDLLRPVDWGASGILAAGDGGESLHNLSVESGEAELLYELEHGHLHGASFISGTDAVLAVVHHIGGEIEWSLRVISPEAGEMTVVVENARSGIVTASGHLVFVRDGTLIARRFDRGSLSATGAPVPIVTGVRRFSVSDNGTLAYLPAGEAGGTRSVIAVDREGAQRTVYEGDAQHLRYSPNGRWVSVIVRGGFDLIDLRTASIRPIRHEGYGLADHVWRTDSRAVIYTAFPRDGEGSVIFEHPIDGGAPRVLIESESNDETAWPVGYAPDGSGFVTSHYTKKDSDLGWVPAGGTEAQPLLATEKSEDLARFSPDTKLLAYESTESGRQEVWLARFVADEVRLAEKWRVSQNGGKDPIWSADGTELYYEDPDDNLMSVPIGRDENGGPIVGRATPLFDLRQMQVSTGGDQSYDASPSGDEWIFIRTGAETSTEVRVVLDWFAELERLVQAGG